MNVCHHAVMFSFPKSENCKDLPAALLSFHQEKTHHAKKNPQVLTSFRKSITFATRRPPTILQHEDYHQMRDESPNLFLVRYSNYPIN